MKARTEAEPEETNYGSFNLLGTFIAEAALCNRRDLLFPSIYGSTDGSFYNCWYFGKRVAPTLFYLQGWGQILAAPLTVCFVCVKGRKEGFIEMWRTGEICIIASALEKLGSMPTILLSTTK